MQPFLDARFTQGALDGGERGSGRGLAQLLDELIAYVEEVCSLFFGRAGGGCSYLILETGAPRTYHGLSIQR